MSGEPVACEVEESGQSARCVYIRPPDENRIDPGVGRGDLVDSDPSLVDARDERRGDIWYLATMDDVPWREAG